MPRKLPYTAGDLFAVPLADAVWSVGLAARTFGRGGILSYFFGNTYPEAPRLEELENVNPAGAIWITRHGDLGLLQGQWLVLGPLPGWHPDAWPVPMFRRQELLTGRLLGVIYQNERLDQLGHEFEIPQEQFESPPEDGLAGAEFVRLRLRRLHGLHE